MGVRKGEWLRCPLLDPDGSHVVFGGNGSGKVKRRGMGYRVSTWASRAGYAESSRRGRSGRHLREFLSDLNALAGPMGLIVAALAPRTGQWYGIEELLDAAGVAGGQKAVESLHLRVYATDDYRERWRCRIAERAGFSMIPGGAATGPVTPPPTAPTSTTPTMASTTVSNLMAEKPGHAALNLSVAMRRARVTHQKLADHLGVSRAFITQILSGRRSWPSGMLASAQAYVAGRAAAGGSLTAYQGHNLGVECKQQVTI